MQLTYGTPASMTITNLNSLASSQTAGWQSARVDNTSIRAIDYQINIAIDLANTAAANDKALYVYVVPWFHDGSNWLVGGDGGNATPPSGSQDTYTLATVNNLPAPVVMNYNTTDQIVNKQFNLSDVFGMSMPQGWSLVIINFTGAATHSSGNAIWYASIT